MKDWWNAVRRGEKAESLESLESLGRFWQAIQRTLALAGEPAPIAPAVADLLKDLSETFSFVAPTGKGERAGAWLLASDGSTREPTPLHGTPTPALRGPDGLVLEPAGWLKIPAQWPAESPLVHSLLNAQALITGLRARDPEWGGWSEIEGFRWELTYCGPGLSPGSPAPEVVRSAFELAYRRAWQGDPLAIPFQELARRLYGGLTGTGISLFPRLHSNTLETIDSDEAIPPGTKVSWVPDRARRRERSPMWSVSESKDRPVN